MRKSIFATLTIILGVALAWAAPPVDKLPSLLTTPAEARITSVIVGGSPPAANECTGYLICQNFEGAGYDNAESWTEKVDTATAVNEDYTGTVLRGSQSLYVDDSSGSYTDESYSYTSFSAQATVYIHIMFRIVDTGSNTELLTIRDSSGTNLFEVLWLTASSALRIYHGSVSADSATTVSSGTTYHLWVRYSKGTGANGIGALAVGTTGTKPADSATLSNGDSTGDAARVYCQSYNGIGVIFDQVYVSNSSIGNVP